VKNDLYNSDGFIWSEAWQEAVIGHCFRDPKMYIKCVEHLSPGWFTASPMLQQMFTSMKEWYFAQGKLAPPSWLEILEMQLYKELPPSTVQQYATKFKRCCEASIHLFSYEVIKQHLTGFARAHIFKEAVAGATEQFGIRDYTKAYKWAELKIQELLKTNFEEDLLAMDFTDPYGWLVEEQKRKNLAITTGNDALDSALGGGLFKRETSAIMAPTNTGKTTFLVTIVRHAIVSGKRVMFFTHEGRPEAVRASLVSALVGVPKSQLYEYSQTPEGKLQLKRASELMKQYLTYIPYSYSGKMFVENVLDEAIKRQKDARDKKEQHYDIIVDDYPKKLKSRYRTGSKDLAYRTEIAEIYDEFNHLSQELDVHCLLAIQTNRAGAKQNKDRKSETMIDLEAIDESYGIAQNMANVVSLNRSPSDMQLEIVNFTVTKSRNNQTHITVNTRTAYDTSLTHGEKKMFETYGQAFLKRKARERGLAYYASPNAVKYDSTWVDSELQKLEGPNHIAEHGPKFEVIERLTLVPEISGAAKTPQAPVTPNKEAVVQTENDR